MLAVPVYAETAFEGVARGRLQEALRLEGGWPPQPYAKLAEGEAAASSVSMLTKGVPGLLLAEPYVAANLRNPGDTTGRVDHKDELLAARQGLATVRHALGDVGLRFIMDVELPWRSNPEADEQAAEILLAMDRGWDVRFAPSQQVRGTLGPRVASTTVLRGMGGRHPSAVYRMFEGRQQGAHEAWDVTAQAVSGASAAHEKVVAHAVPDSRAREFLGAVAGKRARAVVARRFP